MLARPCSLCRRVLLQSAEMRHVALKSGVRYVSNERKSGFQSYQLKTNQDIEGFFRHPTWSVSELLSSKSAGVEQPEPDFGPEQLRHILDMTGLAHPKTEKEEQRLIGEIVKQLVFVEHIESVNVEGVEPLSRIVEDSTPLTLEDLEEPEIISQSNNNDIDWDPLSYASKRDGDFYVLDEGLRKEH